MRIFLLYLLPMLLNFIGMGFWIFVHDGYEKVPRWGAMLWFFVAFVPGVNWFIGFISFVSIFGIDRVYNWLTSPVKR